ncbi:DUF4124 domain-containing protein [Undibacterium amnicola]|uniref:DUF4124 domain-containing protein n=1 Tax=Undibacterium amnicola TaxID=1834038 RepID=A0ABR6XN62_9BURK|nr:DUF4124 domain-containing protein [Undibacterium amnicola]MBC3830951.1 DUF4124 domain-containing protein [Undibacterium amnicola]
MSKLVFAVLLVVSTSASAQLYKCEKDGKITVGDQPCPKSSVDLNPQKLIIPPPPKPVTQASSSPESRLKFYNCSYNDKSLKPCLPDNPVKVSVKNAAILQCVASLKSGLKDPHSAKILKAVRGAPDTIKGELVRYYWVDINAKNSFGAFAGPTAYACLMNADESKLLFAGTDIEAAKMTDPIPNLP